MTIAVIALVLAIVAIAMIVPIYLGIWHTFKVQRKARQAMVEFGGLFSRTNIEESDKKLIVEMESYDDPDSLF